MENLKDNTQLPQTDVKSRFFAQYYGQEILRWHQWIETTPNIKVDLSIPAIEKKGWFVKLKHISKITDKDAEHIMQLEGFIDGFLSDDFLNFLNDLKKGHCNKFEVIDYLRSKGYALPFMEYSIDDLISFGWVQLV